MPDPLNAPRFPISDPSDPLSLDRLRSGFLDAEQAIRAYDREVRLYRDLSMSPEWPQIQARIAVLLSEADAAIGLLKATKAIRRRAVERMNSLDMTRHENIQAAANADEALAAIESELRSLGQLRDKLAKRCS